MKFNVYAVKDIKKGVFLQPFFVPFYTKEEEVKVDFARNLKAAESIISKFPEDFELWRLGSWMDETGLPTDLPVGLGEGKICSADDLLKEDKKDVRNSEVGEVI